MRRARSKRVPGKAKRDFTPNQSLFIASQVITSIFNTIITGVFMTGFLLYSGVSITNVGIVMTIPMFSSVLQLTISKLWHWLGDHKRWITIIVLLSRLAILSIVLIPLLIPQSSEITVLAFRCKTRFFVTALVLVFAYLFASTSGIKLNYWLVTTVGKSKKGVFFVHRDRIVVVITMIISVFASFIIDRLEPLGKEYHGFLIVFGLTACLAIADYLIMTKIEYPDKAIIEDRLSKQVSVKDLFKSGRITKIFLYIFLVNFGLFISMPYYNSYMIEVLELKYMSITMLTAVQITLQIMVSPYSSRMIDRVPMNRILLITTTVFALQFILWAFVTKQTILLIVVIFLTTGIVGGGHSIALFNLPYDYIDERMSNLYLSMAATVQALACLLGSVVGSNIIRWLANMSINIKGLTFGAMQINMMVSSVFILISIIFLKVFVLKIQADEANLKSV